MSANPNSKWYWNDWVNDRALAVCSLAAQGLWMRMLAIAAPEGGYVRINGKGCSNEDIATLVGRPVAEVAPLIAELADRGVFSRTRDGTIYNRRMVRDEKRKKQLVIEGKKGGNPELARGTVPKSQRVRPFRRSDSPRKTEAIFAKSNGCCHWCGVPLARGGGLRADTFHVDHVVGVRDGGSNDIENLVASCASCNHARARKDWQNSSDINPVMNPMAKSDSKAPIAHSPIPNKNLSQPALGVSEPREAESGGKQAGWLADFEISEIWLSEAGEARSAAGLPAIDLRPEAEKIRAYWRKSPPKDPHSAWIGWALNARADRANGAMPHGPDPPSPQRDRPTGPPPPITVRH